MLDKNGVLLLSSSSQLPSVEGVFLSGTLIRGREIYDGEGWIEVPEWRGKDIAQLVDGAYGRFLLINHQPRDLELIVDDSGSEPLFLYRSSGGWVVSNSLFCMVEFVKQKRWPLTLNEGSLAAIFVDHSIGRTMFSPRTVYSEIELLPLDSVVQVSKESGTCRVSRLKVPVSRCFDYEDRLVDWVLRWRGILSAISKRESCSPMLLDLSGGVDSRMVLSLYLPNKNDCRLKVHTQRNSRRDADVAKSLGSLFEFQVGHYGSPATAVAVSEQFRKYLIGNLNCYHMPVKPVLWSEPSDVFKINGIGGEVIRDFYPGTGKEWISKVSSILPLELNQHREQVKEQLEECFSTYGVDPESGVSMREHYRQLRSRIHGGRRLHEKYKYKFLSPLLDREFQKLAYVDGAPDAEGIYRDILLCGGGSMLACHPFDQKRKNFSDSYCRESRFYRSGTRSILEAEMKEFSYVRVKPVDRTDLDQVEIDRSDSGDFRTVHARLEYELIKLLGDGAEEAMPAGFQRLLHSGAGGSTGHKKELRDVVWFSAVTACLNT